MRIYKVLALLAVGVLFTSCASTWSHQSGNNSNLDTDKRYCGATANAVAPTNICRNPLRTGPCFHDFPKAQGSSLELLLVMGSRLAPAALGIRQKRQCQMRREYKLEISSPVQYPEDLTALMLRVHASSFYFLELC